MVAAAMKAVFVIQTPEQVRAHWQRVSEMLRKQFPGAVPVMEAARDDVLAFLDFPQEHWRKIWSSRRNGSWSAAASSPRPPWPKSPSQRRCWSSLRAIQP